MNNRYDVIIVGGGPAGMSAALYLCRANLKILLIEKEMLGGQMNDATHIGNYLGIDNCETGYNLAVQMQQHLINEADPALLDFYYGEVTDVNETADEVEVMLKSGLTFFCNYCLLTTGLKHRELGLSNEKELINQGYLSYCANCDAALFKDKEVVVAGGGESAAQYALLLSHLCTSVYVCDRADFKYMSAASHEKLINTPNIYLFSNHVVDVKQMKTDTDDERDQLCVYLDDGLFIMVNGIFVAIGLIPHNPQIIVNGTNTINNPSAYIYADPDGKVGGCERVFAAGDCVAERSYHQVVLAAAEGATAALSIIKKNA